MSRIVTFIKANPVSTGLAFLVLILSVVLIFIPKGDLSDFEEWRRIDRRNKVIDSIQAVEDSLLNDYLSRQQENEEVRLDRAKERVRRFEKIQENEEGVKDTLALIQSASDSTLLQQLIDRYGRDTVLLSVPVYR